MTDPNRKTVRAEFAALLRQALVGADKPAQAVYAHRPGDFGNASPVVTVSGAGSMRERIAFRGMQAKFHLQVDIFVLYATEDGTWTEAMAEDRLDDIETAISAVIEASQVTAWWDSIAYDDRSERLDVVIGGVDYIRETFLLTFE